MDKMLRFHDKREAEGILVRASRPVGQTIGEGAARYAGVTPLLWTV